MMSIKQDLITHVLNCDVKFFEKHKIGELNLIFNQEISSIAKTATGAHIMAPVQSLLNSFGHLLMIWMISRKLTLALLLTVPLYIKFDSYYMQHNIILQDKQLKK